MSKKLIIFITYITFNVAFTNGDCKFGKGLVKDFDYKKFAGPWFFYLANSKETTDSYTCSVNHYNATSKTLLATSTLISPRSKVMDQADLHDFSNNPFGVDFHGSLSKFSGRFFVTGTDYTSYSILKGCFFSKHMKSFSWITFRTKNPNQDELNGAKQAVENLGLKWKDFYSFCIPLTNK